MGQYRFCWQKHQLADEHLYTSITILMLSHECTHRTILVANIAGRI